MLPAKHILPLRGDSVFFKTARKHFFPFGVIFYVISEAEVVAKQQSAFQAAVIIPKKYWKKATQRNYLKRLVKSAIWQAARETNVALEQSASIKMVVFLSKSTTYQELVAHITTFFKKQRKHNSEI